MFVADGSIDLWLRSALLGPMALVWVVGNVRLIGARSFSKMTAFDFVITVAIGSLLASAATVTSWPSFVQTVVSMSALFILQFAIAKIRFKSEAASEIMSNDPKLLFSKGEFHKSTMAEARVTKADILGKMREANALKLAEISAVILEPTGDISVLHGGEPDSELRID